MTTVSNGRAVISRFHEQPGHTVAVFEHWRDRGGRSSYERLVDELRPLPRDAEVLDLACGDGYLLSMLAREGFESIRGVDASPHELAAARERLGPHVELRHEDAHALAAPDHSVDVVTCHMALMLMESAESVLDQIARVLVPGGSLLAVINRGLHDPVMEVQRRELRRVTAEAGLEPFACGDRRAFTEGGLRELLGGPRWSPEHLRLEDFCVEVRATPPRLWAMLRLNYDVFRLPAAAQAELGAKLVHAWGPMAADGQLTCRMGMRLVACRTRPTPTPLHDPV